ncbi:MAG TPA: hypothetical protein VGO18_30570, partial [Steroidobacteraceae bacterium]|nr:hypothetical protein [Steroidobacteraceae bacterium]
ALLCGDDDSRRGSSPKFASSPDTCGQPWVLQSDNRVSVSLEYLVAFRIGDHVNKRGFSGGHF